MLKPCPFCGCEAVLVNEFFDDYLVMCSNSGCAVEGPLKATSDEAETAWNTRPDGVVEAARKALDAHHREAYLTCPETCWCWDLETALTKYEAAVGGE